MKSKVLLSFMIVVGICTGLVIPSFAQDAVPSAPALTHSQDQMGKGMEGKIKPKHHHKKRTGKKGHGRHNKHKKMELKQEGAAVAADPVSAVKN